MIHQPLSHDRIHPQFVPDTVSTLSCSSGLIRHILRFVYFIFFKELMSFIGSLDKCHTSVFNALIFLTSPFSKLQIERKTDLSSI